MLIKLEIITFNFNPFRAEVFSTENMPLASLYFFPLIWTSRSRHWQCQDERPRRPGVVIGMERVNRKKTIIMLRNYRVIL